MENYTKILIEQIEILWEHRTEGSDINYTFVRDHALTMLHACEQALAAARHSTQPEGEPQSHHRNSGRNHA